MVTRRYSADVGAGFEEDFQKRMEFPFPVVNRGRTDVLGDQDRHGTPLEPTLDDREKNDFRHHIGDVDPAYHSAEANGSA
jgi:hypothetical protein